MLFTSFKRLSDRARSAAGANLCRGWLQERLFPNLAIRIRFSWLEVPYSSCNQNSVLWWLPGALIIPLVNFNMVYAYSAAEKTRCWCKPSVLHICGLLWELLRCLAFCGASALEQFSRPCTPFVSANSSVEDWLCLTLGMGLGHLGHSPVPPSVHLGEWREISGCGRWLRVQADGILLWALLLILVRAEGTAQRGQIQDTAVQVFKHAAEKGARSWCGVSWFGSCFGDAIQNHIGWQGHYFIFLSSIAYLRGGNCRHYLFLSGKTDLKYMCLKLATVWARLTWLHRHMRPQNLPEPN